MEFSLDCGLVTGPIFRDFNSINKSPFETEFSLDCDLVTEPMFHDFFSINKSSFEMDFSLDRGLVAEPIFRDFLVSIEVHLKWNLVWTVVSSQNQVSVTFLVLIKVYYKQIKFFFCLGIKSIMT